jgi:hypothetical protein
MTDPVYLDYLCAEWAGQLKDDLTAKPFKNPINHVQKSMGILQEDGLYAFGVYQKYKDKEGGATLGTLFTEFLTGNPLKPILFPGSTPTAGDLPSVLRQLTSQSLAQIFLARDLILRVLVYAYYHLRAEKKPEQD